MIAQVGLGGKGSDPAYPECQICRAYGGGGHGGFCPNGGRYPEYYETVVPAGVNGWPPRSGWAAWLGCGHVAGAAGTAPAIGDYVTCPAHQGQQKVTAIAWEHP
jgi:hypothetical protein